MNRSLSFLLCAASLVAPAVAGDIAVQNRDPATYDIALSVTAPGAETLTQNVMPRNRATGTLARNVPTGISWELLVWKRTAASEAWTFSTAYTLGEFDSDPGRRILLIDPANDQVSQAYAEPSGTTLDPLPPMLPGWNDSKPNPGSTPPPSDCGCNPSTPWSSYPMWHHPATDVWHGYTAGGVYPSTHAWHNVPPVYNYRIKRHGRRWFR